MQTGTLLLYPPPPDPEPHLVAVLDLLGYRSHLWDLSRQHRAGGLTSLYETYFLLLHAAGWATTIDELQLTDDGRLIAINEAVNFLVASDTLMLWAPPPKMQYLVAAVARLVVGALQFNAPLRGALAYGDCIMEASKEIFIGYPVVEAVEGEKQQDWIGVGVLPGAAVQLTGNAAVVDYQVPMKLQSAIPPIRHALAWHWAEDSPGDAEVYLARNRSDAPASDHVKYDNALKFVRSVPLK